MTIAQGKYQHPLSKQLKNSNFQRFQHSQHKEGENWTKMDGVRILLAVVLVFVVSIPGIRGRKFEGRVVTRGYTERRDKFWQEVYQDRQGEGRRVRRSPKPPVKQHSVCIANGFPCDPKGALPCCNMCHGHNKRCGHTVRMNLECRKDGESCDSITMAPCCGDCNNGVCATISLLPCLPEGDPCSSSGYPDCCDQCDTSTGKCARLGQSSLPICLENAEYCDVDTPPCCNYCNLQTHRCEMDGNDDCVRNGRPCDPDGVLPCCNACHLHSGLCGPSIKTLKPCIKTGQSCATPEGRCCGICAYKDRTCQVMNGESRQDIIICDQDGSDCEPDSTTCCNSCDSGTKKCSKNKGKDACKPVGSSCSTEEVCCEYCDPKNHKCVDWKLRAGGGGSGGSGGDQGGGNDNQNHDLQDGGEQSDYDIPQKDRVDTDKEYFRRSEPGVDFPLLDFWKNETANDTKPPDCEPDGTKCHPERHKCCNDCVFKTGECGIEDKCTHDDRPCDPDFHKCCNFCPRSRKTCGPKIGEECFLDGHDCDPNDHNCCNDCVDNKCGPKAACLPDGSKCDPSERNSTCCGLCWYGTCQKQGGGKCDADGTDCEPMNHNCCEFCGTSKKCGPRGSPWIPGETFPELDFDLPDDSKPPTPKPPKCLFNGALCESTSQVPCCGVCDSGVCKSKDKCIENGEPCDETSSKCCDVCKDGICRPDAECIQDDWPCEIEAQIPCCGRCEAGTCKPQNCLLDGKSCESPSLFPCCGRCDVGICKTKQGQKCAVDGETCDNATVECCGVCKEGMCEPECREDGQSCVNISNDPCCGMCNDGVCGPNKQCKENGGTCESNSTLPCCGVCKEGICEDEDNCDVDGKPCEPMDHNCCKYCGAKSKKCGLREDLPELDFDLPDDRPVADVIHPIDGTKPVKPPTGPSTDKCIENGEPCESTSSAPCCGVCMDGRCKAKGGLKRPKTCKKKKLTDLQGNSV